MVVDHAPLDLWRDCSSIAVIWLPLYLQHGVAEAAAATRVDPAGVAAVARVNQYAGAMWYPTRARRRVAAGSSCAARCSLDISIAVRCISST